MSDQENVFEMKIRKRVVQLFTSCSTCLSIL